ncbi:hypothetical protein [Saccharopolyspora elongata]|uniref:DUF1440 domain-containing protein n=1 Tax=Saccharopolyspora elongata TaxID=2530387 RepID=A0A4R4ZD87_9PSEU|nr:hypothetical protein [Saccharopolyspora elongata]TDD55239.1 hypothetical protein E1288_05445 [Saccharopolyspora elongata]
MSVAHPAHHPVQLVLSRGLYGALAGIGGGIVFGILMAAMGMLPMVAMLVGSTNVGVGVVVHLVISAILGAGFGLVAPFTEFWPLLGAGVVYGAVWWVLGGLLLMPVGLGMPVFQVGQMAVMSLVGHLLYGIVMSVVLFGFRRRAGHV